MGAEGRGTPSTACPQNPKSRRKSITVERAKNRDSQTDMMIEKELTSREEKGGWNGKESEGLKQGQAINATAATSLAQ